MESWKLGPVVLLVAALGTATFFYVAFGAFLPWREEAEAARLVDIVSLRQGQTVADVGAGGGRFAAALARHVGSTGRVYATDISRERLTELSRRAEALPNLTVRAATATDTRLPDECCHLVLMRTVYHHVTDPESFVRALRRALAPGGRVAIIDFAPGALWFHGGGPATAPDRRPGHGVSQAAVVHEFTGAGFDVERQIERWSGPLWLTVFRIRQ